LSSDVAQKQLAPHSLPPTATGVMREEILNEVELIG